MKKTRKKYKVINFAVIFITVFLFVYDYRNTAEIFKEKNFIMILIVAVAALLVHTIKAARLYLALYGSDIDSISYIKTYCKVTPISVVIPFKLGEFFRMYEYGRQIGNGLKGIIIILLDRFMDTIALVTAIIFVWVLNGGQITSFVYILLIFLITVLLIYFVYPGIYKFWKKYLLKSKASENKLAALKILEAIYRIYQEIEKVVEGRGIILYFMSVAAWGIEIGNLAVINSISKEGYLDSIIADYLISAMRGNQTIPLKQFVFVSVILLITGYFIIVTEKLWMKHSHSESNVI